MICAILLPCYGRLKRHKAERRRIAKSRCWAHLPKKNSPKRSEDGRELNEKFHSECVLRRPRRGRKPVWRWSCFSHQADEIAVQWKFVDGCCREDAIRLREATLSPPRHINQEKRSTRPGNFVAFQAKIILGLAKISKSEKTFPRSPRRGGRFRESVLRFASLAIYTKDD